MVDFNRTDLEFILTQIKVAESGQDPVNPHLAFGLRTVDGSNNSLVNGQETYGSSDQIEPRVANPVFRTAEGVPAGFFGPGSPSIPGSNYASTNGYVFDSQPRVISNLISDQTANNPAAVQAAQQAQRQLGDGYLHTLPGADGILGTADDVIGNTSTPAEVGSDGSLFINNVTPDAGLSAPYNGLFTLFGQFFDHGLDATNKGGSGTIFIPLQPDDPLYVPGGNANFMVLTRATNQPGPDGKLGTADDMHTNSNSDTPWVDQSQTYSSHPSHQVFLREYIVGSDGAIHSTGNMLSGANGGEPTWADVKANALKLGIQLNDTTDVVNIPLLKTDAYGNFIADPLTGLAQIVLGAGADGKLGTDDDILAHGTRNADGSINAITTDGAQRIGTAFINDMANAANPVNPSNGRFLLPDSDGIVNDAAHPLAAGYFDVDLLNQHYIAGDGRINENIGLTSIHTVFHGEHNRLVDQIKDLVTGELAKGDTGFATEWTIAGASLADGIQDNEWNGERLFQAARFGTETQYQHLVFEEFARKVSPAIHAFGNVNIHLDPAITEEFANAVYRFGHSMLDENINRYQIQGKYLDANGQPTDTATGVLNPTAGTPVLDANGQPVLNAIGLIDAFTNPLAFAVDGKASAGEILTGSAGQIGNEIDEFVTGTLRNNLLGLPLDLAAINIARGRDVGIAPLNVLRNQLYTESHDSSLKAYTSWADFGQNLKHSLSLINFVAAYGLYDAITNATTVADKRAAALDVVTLGLNAANSTAAAGTHARDAWDFMHSLGKYAAITDPVAAAANANTLHNADHTLAYWSTGDVTGLDHVDLWIGGLAEKQNLFGGLLGSTFDFIFRSQMENLQDADRFYYLTRLEGTHFLNEIENNSFAEMIMHNTDTKHISASVFATPEYTVEAAHVNPDDPTSWLKNPVTGKTLIESHWVLDAAGNHAHGSDGADIKEVTFVGDDNFLGNTIVLGGTEHDDYLTAGAADGDTVYGDGGNDHIDGGTGDDFLYGGAGDDFITDSGGNDTIHGDAGNDTIYAGIGDDIVFGNDGNDIIDGGKGIDDIQGGQGNDIIYGGEGDDEIQGNEGADWIEGGQGGDVLVGDIGAPTGQLPLYGGDDVIIGGSFVAKDAKGHPLPDGANAINNNGGDRMQGFSGDDIMVGGGGFNKFDGRKGFDWASFENDGQGVEVDMNKKDFILAGVPASADAIRDIFIEVEGVSGSSYGDHLIGTNDSVADPDNELTNIGLIENLDTFFSPGQPVHYNSGNLMLGGGGSDVIQGGGGDDIIDGDAYLHVELKNGQIVRQILNGGAKGDVDTAVYSDIAANYAVGVRTADGRGWNGLDSEGFVSVVHVTVGAGATNDGVDKIRNIERLQFSDSLHTVSEFAPVKLTNQLPVGTVAVTGNAVVGQTLTVSQSLFDQDKPGGGAPVTNATFQWQYLDPARGEWVSITGATASTYKVGSFVVGQPLRVAVSFVDALGYTEVVDTAQTAVVTPQPGVNTRPFIVPQQGQIGLPDTNVTAHAPVNLFLPVTKVFGDAETVPASLAYSVTLANGAALSTVGLSVIDTVATNGALQIVGTLPNALTGSLDIRVTASDAGPGAPLSVTDTFTVTIVQPSAGSFTTVNGTLNDGYIAGATVFMDSNDDGHRQSFEAQTTSDAAGHFTLSGKPGTLIARGGPGAVDIATGLAFTDLYKAPSGSTVINALTTALVNLMDLGNVGLDSAQDTLRGALQLDAHVDVTQIDPIAAMHSADAATQALGTHLFSISAEMLNTVAMLRAAVPNADPAGDMLALLGAGVPFDLKDAATVATLVANTGLFGGFADDVARIIVDVNTLLEQQAAAGTPDQMLAGMTAVTMVAQGALASGLAGAFELADLDTLTQAFTGQALADMVALAQHHVGDVNGDGTVDNDHVATGTVVMGTMFDDVLSPTAVPSGQPFPTDKTDYLFGFGGDDTLDGGAGADVMHGGTGNDTYVVDDAGDIIDESGDLTGIDSVKASISYDLRDTHITGDIENLTLTGTGDLNGTGNSLDNVLTGNDGANVLSGGAGNDTLNGGGGNDTLDGGTGTDVMSGGNGDDTYRVDAATDVVHEAVGGGNDTVLASVSYRLGAGEEVETLQANAGSSNLTLTGNALANTLVSGGGDDRLIGGGGNDRYVVNSSGDIVDESTGNAGDLDTVVSSITFDLSDTAHVIGAVENLTLNGTANLNGTGNALANVLTGNGGDNVLSGGAGNDTLNGGGGNDTLDGGTGSDIMSGGLGDDIYKVDAATDVVHEAAGEGTDTVLASVSYTLGAGEEIEILKANATGTTPLTLTGNAFANTLISGAGNDILSGGAGDDTYLVNGALDVVHEALNSGTDTVLASVSYKLGAGEEIEILQSNSATGLTLTGNEKNNTLISGAGNDTLAGGAGNDTYIVNGAGDIVQEGVNGGIDTVLTAVSYALGAGQEVEILQANGATTALTLTGNEKNNTLVSTAGLNDTLIGGAGNDIYKVNDAGDIVQENAGGGSDTVQTTVSYTLATGQEIEVLQAMVSTGLTLTGNEKNNTLISSSGVDTLIGGAGNDIYQVNNSGDVVHEALGGGSDTVQASVDYTLGAGEEIETLQALGTTGLTLTGNEKNNTLISGAGADVLVGGAGNDTYQVNGAADVVREAIGGGSDTVLASVSWSLSAGQEVETLRANAGTTGITLGGNEFANTLISGAGNDTLVGGAGNDTYQVNNAGDLVQESVGGGIDTVLASVSYVLAAGQEIEILKAGVTTGLTLTGNEFANTLISGTGNDVLFGGGGNDTYQIDSAGDVVNETGDTTGIDTVVSAISFDLGDTVHAIGQIENLTLTGTAITGTGNALDNIILGNAAANILNGGAGNDTIDGGAGNDIIDGGTGADTMTGGSGNDTFKVDNAGDVVHEAASGGTDTVLASVSYALGGGEEIEILQSVAAVGVTLTGNEKNNTLISGAGDDVLAGGLGNDTYQVNSAGDVVHEAVGGGTDTVLASVSYALGAGEEIETLQANAGTTGIALTGNEKNNTLISGAGFDTLAGGLGNDTYQVNSANDVVHEAVGGGLDTVLASVSYTLGAGEEIETLKSNTALAVTLTGNEFGNTLVSGAGLDTLVGGLGNDTYQVNNAGDIVHEAVGGGTDTVLASVSYALGAGEEIETLQANAGSLGLTLTGNAFNNTLVSGLGNDVLIGGAGNDVYKVNGVGDVVHEAVGGGLDTVLASASFTLGAGEEVETLQANAGTTGITLTGNEFGNTLISGAGADTLVGGAGDDTYVIDTAGDTVVELAGQGNDTVQTRLALYTLADNVENLTYASTSIGTSFHWTGNASDNVITGGSGNDTFEASVNDGNDTYNGGLGTNTYSLAATSADALIDLTTRQASSAQTGLDKLFQIQNVVGGSGNDTLTASQVAATSNTFTGGAGADTFVFNALTSLSAGTTRDKFADFSQAQGDKIDLKAVDINPSIAGVQHYSFVEGPATLWNGVGQEFGANTQGQIRYHYETVAGVDHTILDLHASNVAGGPDGQIDLTGHLTIHQADLILA